MTASGSSGTEMQLTRLILVGLGLFLVVPVVLLSSTKGSDDYHTAQNGLLAGVIIFSALFLTRIVWLVRIPGFFSSIDRQQWMVYRRSGALAIDLSFVIVMSIFIFLGDLSYWRDYTVRIGTVAAIAVARLLASALIGVRRKSLMP